MTETSSVEPTTPAVVVDEVDVWWGSYSGRTMLPNFIGCGLVSVAIVGIAWWLGAWQGSHSVRFTALALTAAIWLHQVGLWCYRLTAYNYRLSTRRLFCDRGFGFRAPANPGIPLGRIAQILVERTSVESLLDIGRIRVVVKDDPPHEAVLLGVRDPEQVAAKIRKRMKE